MKGEKFRHSYSRISDYILCPHMYKQKHILKKIVEENPIMMVGSVVHDAIARYNNHCIKNQLEHDYPMHEQFILEAFEAHNLAPEYNQEVRGMVKDFCDRHEVDLESVVGAEEEIAVNRNWEQREWMDEDVWMRSIIDYLQIQGDVAKITDYKTGYSMATPEFQLKIYALIVKKIYPQIMKFHVEVDFVRFEYQKDFVIGADELILFEEELLTKIRRIEADTEFKPKVSVACSYCGCWQGCPAMKKQDVGFVMPMNHEEAVDLALKVEKNERLLAESRKVLKEYVDVCGDVVAGGKKHYFKVSKSYRFDSISKLIVEAEEAGIDIHDILTVDKKKMGKMMKNENFRKIVEKVGTKSVSVKFSNKKQAEEEPE